MDKADQKPIEPVAGVDGRSGGKVVTLFGPQRHEGSKKREIPPRLVSPAEQGLQIVVPALIQQLGFHGAYNTLLDAAENVRSKNTVEKLTE